MPESDTVFLQVRDEAFGNIALRDLWMHPNCTSGETLSSL